jgi:UDP-glucose 4-epimerase
MVWGATGFIGRHLLKALTARATVVLAITRRPVELQPPEPLVRWIAIPECETTAEIFADAIRQVDVIYNLAGASGAVGSNLDPIASLENNCAIQARFLRACELAQSKPHVVFASSRLVYGSPCTLPVREDASTWPVSHYAAHKLAVEHYHQIASLRSVISYTVCRISNPYGAAGPPRPGHWFGFIDTLIDKACRGEPMEIYGDGTQVRDYLYIDDLTDALCCCGASPDGRNQTFNIGRGEGLSVWQAAQIICERTGTKAVRRPWPAEAALVESGDYVADITKARKMLGFRPQFDFAETVRHLIERRGATAHVTLTSSIPNA